MKKLNLIASAVLSVGVLALNLGHGLAATGTMYLSPASGAVNIGSSITVSIWENASDVNVVTANLSYDASKFSCAGIGGGDFGADASAPSCGGGNVHISRYTSAGSPALSGAHSVGTVTFTAIAGSGTANVNFAGGSRVVSNGADVAVSMSGGSYSLVTPTPVTPTPGKGGGSTSTTTGSTPSSTSTSPTSPQATSNTSNSSQTSASTSANAPGQASTVANNSAVKSAATATTPASIDRLNTARRIVVIVGILVALVGAIVALERFGYLPSVRPLGNKLKTTTQSMRNGVMHKLNKI